MWGPRQPSQATQQLIWSVPATVNIATGANRFTPILADGAISSTEANVQTRMGKACTAVELSLTATPSATGDLTASLRLAGADVGSVITWTAGGAKETKRIVLANIAVAADALLDVRWNSAAGTATATDSCVVVQYA